MKTNAWRFWANKAQLLPKLEASSRTNFEPVQRRLRSWVLESWTPQSGTFPNSNRGLVIQCKTLSTVVNVTYTAIIGMFTLLESAEACSAKVWSHGYSLCAFLQSKPLQTPIHRVGWGASLCSVNRHSSIIRWLMTTPQNNSHHNICGAVYATWSNVA